MANENSRLVYSTDGGRVKGAKGNPPARANPVAPARAGMPNDGVVRIMRDKKGRGGKTVTLITGLPGAEADLDTLLKTLKQACGTGGTREGRDLIIQGDHRERLQERLTALGHRVKLAGG